MRKAIKKPVKREFPSVVFRKEIAEQIIEDGSIPLRYERIKQEFDKVIEYVTPNKIQGKEISKQQNALTKF